MELWSKKDMEEILPDEVANAIQYNESHDWEHVAEGEDNNTWIVRKKLGPSPIIRLKAISENVYSREQLFEKRVEVKSYETRYLTALEYSRTR